MNLLLRYKWFIVGGVVLYLWWTQKPSDSLTVSQAGYGTQRSPTYNLYK